MLRKLVQNRVTVWLVDFYVQDPDGRRRRFRRRFPYWMDARKARALEIALRDAARIDGVDAVLRAVDNRRTPAAAPAGDAAAPRTVSELCDRYQAIVLPARKPGTARSLTTILRRDVVPAFGKLHPARLDRPTIEAWAARLSGGAATRNRKLFALSAVLTWAQRNGWIQSNPAPALALPERRIATKTPLTAEELTGIIAAADASGPLWAAVVRLAATTGMRAGELAALHVEDVDTRRMTVCVRAAMSNGVRTVPKGGGPRTLPLAAPTAAAVEAQRASLGGKASGPLFPARNASGYLDPSRITRRMRTFAAAAGIPAARVRGIHAHLVRHTVATEALSAGATPTEVQALLGHAELSTTQLYLHQRPEALKTAVARLTGARTERCGQRLGNNSTAVG